MWNGQTWQRCGCIAKEWPQRYFVEWYKRLGGQPVSMPRHYIEVITPNAGCLTALLMWRTWCLLFMALANSCIIASMSVATCKSDMMSPLHWELNCSEVSTYLNPSQTLRKLPCPFGLKQMKVNHLKILVVNHFRSDQFSCSFIYVQSQLLVRSPSFAAFH